MTGYVLKRDPDFRTGDSLRIANYQITALDYENAFIPEFAVKELEPEPEADGAEEGEQGNEGQSKDAMSDKDRERLKFQLSEKKSTTINQFVKATSKGVVFLWPNY